MNEHEPLTPDAVDALLSADLDGELDGAAGELGLSASEARGRLAATPGADARRRALTRAQSRIAARPAIEVPVEDRLVATALAGDDLAAVRARRRRHARQWRVLVAAGSVAAAVAVIVGVSTMNTGQSSKSAGAPLSTNADVRASPGAESAPTKAGRDLGDVTSDAALRAPALRLLAQATRAYTTDGSPTTTTTKTATKTQGQAAAPQSVRDAPDASFEAAARACTPAAFRRYNSITRPAIIAKGTVAGVPVAILIYASAGGRYAYVVRASDCSLVRRQSLN